MNPLRALLGALTPEADEHAARARAVAASLKTLRAEVRAMRREIEAVAARATAVSRQVAQVRQLEQLGLDTPARLDELAALMAADRVAAHVRAAVEGAAVESPARLVIRALWPEDVYQAITRAIPDPVFFEVTASGAQTLRVPPRLAPAAAIATWTCVAEIVEALVVPAVFARFGDRAAGGALDVAPGRLVRRPAASGAPPGSAKAWHWGLIEMDLTAPNEASGTANTAVALFIPAGPYEPPAPDAGVRHTYQVWFGSRPA